jgi:hypothetical protein
MLLRVTDPERAKGEDPFISVKAINQLVKNFLSYTVKVNTKTNMFKKMTYEQDSYSVWYSIAEIQQLIKDNTTPDKVPTGIRIYFGLHSDSEIERDEMPNRPLEYLNHHTGVLVATVPNASGINVDILTTEDTISLSGATGRGADQGSISPPPYPIPGSKVDPT